MKKKDDRQSDPHIVTTTKSQSVLHKHIIQIQKKKKRRQKI